MAARGKGNQSVFHIYTELLYTPKIKKTAGVFPPALAPQAQPFTLRKKEPRFTHNGNPTHTKY